MAQESDDNSESVSRARRNICGLGAVLLAGQVAHVRSNDLSRESPQGHRGSRVIDAQGDVFEVSTPGQGWYATNPVITRNGRGIGSGNSLLYWNRGVYVRQTTGQWFKWSGSTLVTVGVADPSGTEPVAGKRITVEAPTPSPDCIRAKHTEAELAAGADPGLIYLSFAKDKIAKQGFTNFYTDHIREFKLINGVWFAKHGSYGTNPDGSTYLTPTLCSWTKPLPAALEQYWVSWTLIIDPDVKVGLLEEGIKLHGLNGNQDLLPGAIAWIGRSDRSTSPARYPLKTYEYHQDGQVQLKADTSAFMYEGITHTIDLRLKMNTPGVADGEREMWIDDRRVLSQKNVNFRSNAGALWSVAAAQIFAGGTGRPAREIHVWSGPLLIHATHRPGMLRTP